jgi:hypothetical protein
MVKRLLGYTSMAALLATIALLAAPRVWTQTPSLAFLSSSAGPVPWQGSTAGVPVVTIAGGSASPDTLCLDSTNKDACLARDAANTFAQRNGTNAQGFSICNTYTSATSFECFKIDFGQSVANIVRMATTKGSGAGSYRSLTFQAGISSSLTLGSNDVITFGNSLGNAWTIDGTRNIVASTTNSFNIGTSTTVGAPANVYAGTKVEAPTINATTALQINGVAVTIPAICSNTSASTAITTTATETAFDLNCKIAASTLVAGSTIVVDLRGIYSGANTDTLIFKLKACTVSGCGSGTVVTLATTSAVTLSAVSNQYWDVQSQLIAWTVGVSGTIDAQTKGLVASTGIAATTLTAPSTATATVNTTVDEYLTLTGKFSTASASDSATMRNLRVVVQ